MKNRVSSIDQLVASAVQTSDENQAKMHADRIVAKMEKVLQAKLEAAKAVGEDTPNSICTDTYSVNGNKVRFFYSREAESRWI